MYIDCIYIYVIVNAKPSKGKLYRCHLPSPKCDDLANRKVRIPISPSLFGCLDPLESNGIYDGIVMVCMVG